MCMLASYTIPLGRADGPTTVGPFFVFLCSVVCMDGCDCSFMGLPFISIGFFRTTNGTSVESLRIIPVSPFSSTTVSPTEPYA